MWSESNCSHQRACPKLVAMWPVPEPPLPQGKDPKYSSSVMELYETGGDAGKWEKAMPKSSRKSQESQDSSDDRLAQGLPMALTSLS